MNEAMQLPDGKRIPVVVETDATQTGKPCFSLLVPLAAACRAKANSIQPEDVARLSPLVFEHINLLGRYAFSVPDSVVRGQLRPLRNPADALDDVD